MQVLVKTRSGGKMSYNSPTQITDSYIKTSICKASAPIWKLFILGIVAGVLIGFGAVASSTAAHAISNVGLVRLVTGTVFPIGLVMVVLLGTELFTGNCLMITAVYARQITVTKLLRNWVVVYIGNFVGAVLLAACMAFFGQLDIGGGDLAAYTAKLAASKASLSWQNALALGVFCNILVCIAVYLGSTAQDTAGRIMGLFLPIFGFVVAGFEHSVANMYYIPAGIFANMNAAYSDLIVQAGIDTSVLNFGTFFVNNLIPVTIGNIIGGILVGSIMYVAHATKHAKQ